MIGQIVHAQNTDTCSMFIQFKRKKNGNRKNKTEAT